MPPPRLEEEAHAHAPQLAVHSVPRLHVERHDAEKLSSAETDDAAEFLAPSLRLGQRHQWFST